MRKLANEKISKCGNVEMWKCANGFVEQIEVFLGLTTKD